jgi:hypothetical protein
MTRGRSINDAAALADRGIDFHELLGAVAAELATTPAEVLTSSRRAGVVRARFAVARALALRGLSYAAIARLLERDHTTIMDAIARAENDAELRRLSDRYAAAGVAGVALAPLRRLPAPVRVEVTHYLRELVGGIGFSTIGLAGLRRLAAASWLREYAYVCLELAGLEAHHSRIRAHAHQCGLTWVE